MTRTMNEETSTPPRPRLGNRRGAEMERNPGDPKRAAHVFVGKEGRPPPGPPIRRPDPIRWRSPTRPDLERCGSYSVPFASASEVPLTSGVPPSRARGGRGKGPIWSRRTASTTPVFRCSLSPSPDKCSDRPPENRTSLRPPSSQGEEGSGIVRPVGRARARSRSRPPGPPGLPSPVKPTAWNLPLCFTGWPARSGSSRYLAFAMTW